MLRSLLVAFVGLGALVAQDDEPSLAARLAAIRPSETELAYRAIGWRNRFWPAVQEARRLGRPLLFWTMNGHPLGCT